MTTNLKLREPDPELLETSAQNQLLQTLLTYPSANNLLADALTIVSLQTNQVLYEHGDKIEYVYFPIDAVISRLGITDDGTSVETAMVGFEGMVGMSAILGSGHHTLWSWVTIDGTAVRVKATVLDKLFVEDEAALKLLLGCYRSLMTQVSQRCICNTRHTLLERLACWLLMIHDRAASDNLRLTQEMMASRVSVRRAGITIAAGVLQDMRAIECRRGQVQILNRTRLEEVVCECYRALQLGPQPQNVTDFISHLKYSKK